MSVTMNEIRMIVDNSALMDMQVSSSIREYSNTTDALELAPTHPDPEQLLRRREELRDIDDHDEEQPVDHRVRHEREILFLHRHRVQRGRDVQEGEERPPVPDEISRARCQRSE